jgi:hypothetical protein
MEHCPTDRLVHVDAVAGMTPELFFDVPFDMYRGFGFPGALARVMPGAARLLLDFNGWLAKHAAVIPIG